MTEMEAFAEGCGVRLADILDTIEDILVLYRLDLVRWALDLRPDRVPIKAGLAKDAVSYRLRG